MKYIMNETNIQKLINGIIFIENKNTGEKLDYLEITYVKHSSKYSNTKTPIFKLKIDDMIVNKKNPYKVTYTCISCEQQQKVDLATMNRKINNNMLLCNSCINYDENKIK